MRSDMLDLGFTEKDLELKAQKTEPKAKKEAVEEVAEETAK